MNAQMLQIQKKQNQEKEKLLKEIEEKRKIEIENQKQLMMANMEADKRKAIEE